MTTKRANKRRHPTVLVDAPVIRLRFCGRPIQGVFDSLTAARDHALVLIEADGGPDVEIRAIRETDNGEEFLLGVYRP